MLAGSSRPERKGMSTDTLSRIICNELNVRAYTVLSKDTVTAIIQAHEASPAESVFLGRTINATALLSASLKPESDQSVTVKFLGTGAIREIHVQADARGNIRGYLRPGEQPIQGDQAVRNNPFGEGNLAVIKDLGLREPYSNISALYYGDIARDIAYYLTTSEQIPSAILLAVRLLPDGGVAASGGILIQTFPETRPEAISMIESNIATLREGLGDFLARGGDIYSYLNTVLGDVPFTVLQVSPVRFSCRCTRELIFDVLKTLPRDEIAEMAGEGRNAEVVCTFCRKKYTFGPDEIRSIL